MGRTSDAKERLLESAGELIPERGYNAVGIAELCSQARVNKGSFYYFFPSKKDLALALIDSTWDSARAFLVESAGGDEPPLVRLGHYFASMVEHHRRDQQESGCLKGCPFGNLALEMSNQDDDLRDHLSGIFDGHVDFFERLLDEARQRGDLGSGIDPRAAAQALVALVQGQIMLAKLHNDLQPLIDLAPAAFRLVGASPKPEERSAD